MNESDQLSGVYSHLPFTPAQRLAKTFENQRAICFRDFFTPAEVAAATETIFLQRSAWSSGYGGEQFALGEVWYHYREEGLPFSDYSSRAAESNLTLLRELPWLHRKILHHLSTLVAPERAILRQDWAGPGFVIFPAGGRCATLGGDPHYDWDGLELQDVAGPTVAAYSFVSMFAKPAEGGDLAVWPLEAKTPATLPMDDPEVAHLVPEVISYRVGDLWMFPSLIAHQILPFTGESDRVCLTFHIVERGGQWLTWL